MMLDFTVTSSETVENPSQLRVSESRLKVSSFLWLTIQLGLILGVALIYQIELERGFGTVALITFLGFVLHCWVPRRWKLQLFLLLTVLAAAVLLKWDAIWLFGLGLALLGLCHLPIPWWQRLGLLLIAVLWLGVLQAGVLTARWTPIVIPVLASMFMFRLIIYLYDLKTHQTPATAWERLAYFFMLPNLCFPLFPVIDYKTFLATYYDAPPVEIYQKGLLWIMRGVGHLLLYRLIYHYLLPRADSTIGVAGVFLYMSLTYALYLRVSGLFHLITGLLCLFGFNLPRTNNLYFLASSFTDLWRRINIYWKDFMMMTVFYPTLMNTRRWNMGIRLVVSTGMVFLVTWFLHSYQWFWLMGVFPIAATDIAFWGILGLALSANSVWESRRGRQRRFGRPDRSWKAALRISGQTLGVFCAMAILWALWDSGSFSDWSYRLLRIRETTLTGWIGFGAALCLLIGIGTAGQALAARGWEFARVEQVVRRYSPQFIPLSCMVLIFLWFPSVHQRVGGPLESAVVLAQSTKLNSIDALRQERGYYETLSRVSWQGADGQALPEDEVRSLARSGILQNADDVRGYVLVPESAAIFKGAIFTTNEWGMRDSNYDQQKPPGTYRIALIGSSHVVGSGVGDDETFGNVLEYRLNKEFAGHGFDRYEILNFAVGGYGLLQTLYVVENVVPPFEPDLIIYVVHPKEETRFIRRLRRVVQSDLTLGTEYEYVSRALDRADADHRLPESEFTRRLEPFQRDLLRWAFERKITSIRGQHAVPMFLYLPLTDTRFGKEELRILTRIAEGYGALNVIIDDVYMDTPLEDIRVAEGDNHPNAQGHRMIADRLYLELIKNTEATGIVPSKESEGGF